MEIQNSTPNQAMVGDMGRTDPNLRIRMHVNERLEIRILCELTTKEVRYGVIRFKLFLTV